MSNFERLQDHVTDGSIRLIHVEAVPRSVSTALSRALNETDGPSVYVNEPFNRMKHDIDAAAGHILDAAVPMVDTATEPVTVVTKNMARNLSSKIFRQWMPITDGVVWSVRNPLIQIGSLLTRIANDIVIEPGADQITQDELAPYINESSDFLENSGISKGFSKTSWAEIGTHYRSGYQPERSIVIDGDDFARQPERILGRTCLLLGLNYSSRMTGGWQRGYVNANDGYSDKLSDTENGWTKHAASSTGISESTRQALNLEDLPPNLREHIEEVAIPVYEEMTGLSV